jgi:hypothetical protein
VFEHCIDIWNAMNDRAEQVNIEGQLRQVYSGYLTKLFQRKGLSVPYYTSVMRCLQQMDCVRQLRRGGGNAPSMWLIVQEPTKELFEYARELHPVTRSKKAPDARMEQMQQQIQDLNRRISKLENAS